MGNREGNLVIAVVLTVLDVAVAVYCGPPIWVAWSGDILSLGLLVMLGALWVTSLANVWARAVCTPPATTEGLISLGAPTAIPIPVESRRKR